MSSTSFCSSAAERSVVGMSAMSTPALKTRLTASISPKLLLIASMLRASVTETPMKPVSPRRMLVMMTCKRVAGEVLGGGGHVVLLHALHHRDAQLGHEVGVAADGAQADDGVIGAAVGVKDGREVDVELECVELATDDLAAVAGVVRAAGGRPRGTATDFCTSGPGFSPSPCSDASRLPAYMLF